jgi:hypothetical protein
VVLALALVGLTGAVLRAEAQQMQTLVQFTNSWRYDQTGRQLPTNWMTSAYTEDGQWGPPSPGLLGAEPGSPGVYTAHAPILTPLTISGSITTYYFRTTFNYQGSLSNVTLIGTNLVDDGCAIYLNGQRVGGVRIPMGYNALNAAQFFGDGTEGALEAVTFTNVSALRVGQNLLAVEVHQSANPSSDVMFGMKLLSIVPLQLVITDELEDETVVVGETATFTVGVSGGPVTYRWYRGNVLQPSTSNTLNIANAQLASAGTNYYVVVSNIVNVITSRVATLTVVSDTEGPKMLHAILNNSAPGGNPYPTNTINVIFDEPMNQTLGTNATSVNNTNNYRLVSSTNCNIQIAIVRVQYSVILGALLFVDASNPHWNPAGSYYLLVNNVADDNGNRIAPNSVIGVSQVIASTNNIAQTSDVWKRYDPITDVFNSGGFSVFSQDWYGTNYHYNAVEPSTNIWPEGPGIIYKVSGDPNDILCAGDSLGVLIDFVDVPILFRRTLVLSNNTPRGGSLKLRHIIDDGMLLYLNGEIIFRTANMTGVSSINEGTRAPGAVVADAVCLTNDVPVNNLLPGTNWLAAAVCQHATAQGDIVFGLEVDLITTRTNTAPTPPPPPRLTITRQGNRMVISWPTNSTGYSLQYSTNIAGTGPRPDRNWWTNQANWVQAPNQSNPYTNTIPAVGARRFYKLFRQN